MVRDVDKIEVSNFFYFRENERGRQEEYERELAEMKRRVEQRPLLFERESQENARRKAEKKYTQILRDAGVNEHLVNKLVTKDGGIIDAEDSEDSVEEREGVDDDDYEYSLSGHTGRSETRSEHSEQEEIPDEEFEDD